MTNNVPHLNQHELKEFLHQAHRASPALMRWTQTWRPYICPFEDLMAKIPLGAHMADIGCGGGSFLMLCNRYRELASGTGMDISAEAISIAQARNEPGLTYICSADPDDLPARQYDVVSIIDVLHHVPPSLQTEFLEKAAGKVRPGGLLIYKDMARRPWIWAWANRLHDLVLARQWINYLPIETAQTTVAGMGYDVTALPDQRMFWYAHESFVARRPSQPT